MKNFCNLTPVFAGTTAEKNVTFINLQITYKLRLIAKALIAVRAYCKMLTLTGSTDKNTSCIAFKGV